MPTLGKRSRGPGTSMGLGVILSGTPIDASQGPLKKTNQPLDVAIDGPGFFQIEGGGDGVSEPVGVDIRGITENPSGVTRIDIGPEVLYTRSGHWSFNDKGELCLVSGGKLRPLVPRVSVPAENVSVMIGEDGRMTTLKPGEEGEMTAYKAGRIELVRFRNPSALKP